MNNRNNRITSNIVLKSNKLINASSPYLKQHANNPVEWYEWCDEALNLAIKENKPLIISIGYAACHWCHVMADESFMDNSVADYMNEHFISIKVDREERPDIDRIYMDAANIITGSGGWPLNAFALPDGSPFFAGTYYHKDGWLHLLKQIIDIYTNKHDAIIKQSETLKNSINVNKFKIASIDNYSSLNFTESYYKNIFPQLETLIDNKLGGFNYSPKFPLPIAWEFMLQYYYLTHNSQALKSVERTLDAMAEGGIYDQIGGGFSRYSVDTVWKVPHFEKMLYDNGQLVTLYSHAYQITKKERYSEIIQHSLDFIKREMMNSDGGFYSSLNADSEGEEGKFYIWTSNEIENILEEKEAKLIKDYFQITPQGNWEHGRNILFPKSSKTTYSSNNNLDYNIFKKLLNEASGKLLKMRSQRVRPSTDDKILTSWNALMLSGFIDAYKALGKIEYLKIALRNAKFLEKNMVSPNGKLLRNYKDGKSNINAFLDDYAYIADAYIKLYEITFDIHWIKQAKNITGYALSNFFDDKCNLFYYTSKKSETLFARNHEITDNVIPSSNSVLANVMLRLGYYLSDEALIAKAEIMLFQIRNKILTGGPYYANWAMLLGMTAYKPYEIVIAGKNSIEVSNKLQKHYLPTSIISGGNSENLPALKGKVKDNSTIIYICRNKVCKEPTENILNAIEQITY